MADLQDKYNKPEDDEQPKTTEENRTNGDSENLSTDEIRKKIDEILSKTSLKSSDYDSLTEIVTEYPDKMEGKLPDVFKKILLHERSSQATRISYEKLLTEIIKVSIQLRRHHKIVAWILQPLTELLKDPEILRIPEPKLYVLPPSASSQFSSSIASLTNAQIGNVLVSLNYHLESSLKNLQETQETADSARILAIFSDVITPLFTDFLYGIKITSSIWTPSAKQKFIISLGNGGKVLLEFLKIFQEKPEDFKSTAKNFWKIVEGWMIVIKLLKHYDEDAFCGDGLSEVLLCLENLERFLEFYADGDDEDLSSMFLPSRAEVIPKSPAVDGEDTSYPGMEVLEKPWGFTSVRTQTIAQLSNAGKSRLAERLIDNFGICAKKRMMNSVQDDEKFTIAIIIGIFKKIGEALGDEDCATKILLDEINNVNLHKNKRREKTLNSLKTLLKSSEWTDISNKNVLSTMSKYLNLLPDLPLSHCPTNLKTLIFLTTISIKKETPGSPTIQQLSKDILSDIAGFKTGDFLQYFHPAIFIQALSDSPELLARSLESSVANPDNHKLVEESLESHPQWVSVILESTRRVQMMLTPAAHGPFIELEEKLLKKALEDHPEVLNADSLKSLTVAFKAAVGLNKVDADLISRIQAILKILTSPERASKDSEVTGLRNSKESYQLIHVAFQYRAVGITMDEAMLVAFWELMLDRACLEILPMLIEASAVKILSQVLKGLNARAVRSVAIGDEGDFRNCMTIWNELVRTDMGVQREKARQNYLYGLMMTLVLGDVEDMQLTEGMRVEAAKLCCNLMAAKRIVIPEKILDVMLVFVEELVRGCKSLAVAHQIVRVCLAALKFRGELVQDRLNGLWSLYSKGVKIVVEDARGGQSQLQYLVVLEIEKVARAFLKVKGDVVQLSPMIVADLMWICYGGGVVPRDIKESLDDCISQFMTVCDRHDVLLLFRVLPVAMHDIFKKFYDNYNKFYKFTGNV